MLAAVLAVGSLFGSAALPVDDRAHRALVIHDLGQVVVRFDPDGFVLARGCDGRLRPVGYVASPPLRLRIHKDGAVAGFSFAPQVTPEQRQVFQRMMLAFGYSDWKTLTHACLPTGGVSAAQDLQRARVGPTLEVIR